MAGNNLFQSDNLHGNSQPQQQEQQSAGSSISTGLKGFATAMDKVAHNDALAQSEAAKANAVPSIATNTAGLGE